MRLSEYERKVLLASPIYQYYKTTPWATHTVASIEAHLDAITGVSLETLPIIKFLTLILNSKVAEASEDDLTTLVSHGINNTHMYTQHRAVYGALTSTHIHDATYTVDTHGITLSGGALANTVLRSASATTNCSILWFMLFWNTAPGTAYTLTFQDEDDTELMPGIPVLPADMGKKFWVYLDTTVINKDLEVDVAGGAGAETLTLIASTCVF